MKDGFITKRGTVASEEPYYWMLWLLILPFIIMMMFLIVLFVCKPLNRYIYKTCNCVCFKFLRPGDTDEAKTTDATIVYSKYDELWVFNQLLPLLKSFKKPYKIHLLTSYHKSFEKIDNEQFEKLSTSKRIILIFSDNFIREEWKSFSFKNTLSNICANDRQCVIMPINTGKINDEQFEKYLFTLMKDYDLDECCFDCKQRLKNSFKLNDIECLDVDDLKFSDKLEYLMPMIKTKKKLGSKLKFKVTTITPIGTKQAKKTKKSYKNHKNRVLPELPEHSEAQYSESKLPRLLPPLKGLINVTPVNDINANGSSLNNYFDDETDVSSQNFSNESGSFFNESDLPGRIENEIQPVQNVQENNNSQITTNDNYQNQSFYIVMPSKENFIFQQKISNHRETVSNMKKFSRPLKVKEFLGEPDDSVNENDTENFHSASIEFQNAKIFEPKIFQTMPDEMESLEFINSNDRVAKVRFENVRKNIGKKEEHMNSV